jgi:c-di-GMP-related signal transduction protein
VADTLYAQRHQPALPGRDTVLALMRAVDAEQSLDAFEQILGEDPILAYRFMLYTNSAALGLRGNVDSLRRGLVMLGYGTLQRWLSDQLPHACTEPSLVPVRTAMRLRAGLTERLIEAGISHELQREVYLLGLFSQLDLLLGEPLPTVLRRIPLSERVFDAAVTRTGPYAPALLMAIALESDDPAPIRQLREDHAFEIEDVNRILLRMLSELEVQPAPSA